MLSRSDKMVQGMVQGLTADVVAPVQPQSDNSAKKSVNTESAVGTVRAGLREAETLLKLVTKTYRQVSQIIVILVESLIYDEQLTF